jgi:hypothetical protein
MKDKTVLREPLHIPALDSLQYEPVVELQRQKAEKEQVRQADLGNDKNAAHNVHYFEKSPTSF